MKRERAVTGYNSDFFINVCLVWKKMLAF